MASLKVKILTNVTCRRIKGADVYFATAVSDANELVSLSTSEEWITKKLHKDQFFTLLKVNTRKRDADAVDVTLYEDSRVFMTSSFPVNDSVVQAFFNAPLVSIPDALSSPKKRRISLSGTVQKIGDTVEHQDWKRKDIVIADANKNRITFKLWNDTTAADSLAVGKTVTLKNVETNNYNGILSVNSTAETLVETQQTAAVGVHMVIDGADKDGDTFLLFDARSASTYIISKCLFEHNFRSLEELQKIMPLHIIVDLRDDNIVAVTDGSNDEHI